MRPRNRKLAERKLNEDEIRNPHEPYLTITQIPPPRIPVENQTQTSASDKNDLNPNAPFDSSMALTVLALLTALFFMGMFSIYIRRFSAGDSSVEDISRRNRRRQLNTAAANANDSLYITTLPSSSRPRGSIGLGNNKGVDVSTVRSLPVYYYHRGGGAKQGIGLGNDDCAVCLCEFEAREEVKMIPFCRHVFHVGCIEKWLSAHVSCPLCRTTRFFPDNNVVKVVVDHDDDDGRIEVRESTAGRCDTWMGGSSVRRINSCSSIGDRVMLQRTLSF